MHQCTRHPTSYFVLCEVWERVKKLVLLVKTRIILVWRSAPWERSCSQHLELTCLKPSVAKGWPTEASKQTVSTGARTIWFKSILWTPTPKEGPESLCALGPESLYTTFLAGFQNFLLLKNYMGGNPARNYRGEKTGKIEWERMAT